MLNISITTLQIYTTLKSVNSLIFKEYQYNYTTNLHYSQTNLDFSSDVLEYNYTTNLHYSQTCLMRNKYNNKYNYTTNLHYSQTL